MSAFLSSKKKNTKNKLSSKNNSGSSILSRVKKLNFIYFLIILIFVDILAALLIAIFLIGLVINSVTVISLSPPGIKSLPYFFNRVTLPISSYSYVVYEKDSRSIILGKNENLRFTPASTTKIMTAIVSLEHYPLDKVLQVTDEYLVEGSKMKLVPGERISVENLLYGMLLPSGNDAAHVLADNYPGGINGFIAAMNKKAKDLQLTNTHYIDPAGYEDDNFSTAFDMARLTSYALQNPEFRRIVRTKSYTAVDESRINIHELSNLNQLLSRSEVTGVKTGFTNEAGGVLVTSVDISGKTYVIVVLKSSDRFFDTQTIIEEVVKKVKFIKFN